MANWTREQELAIKTPGGELLVSAAAGTGKTAVLVQRVIRLITEEGVDCDRLLVVTFTNAAAAEMKDRLRQALHDKISANPFALHLRNQLSLLERAFIGTIHSFCLDLIKQYFYLVELDPQTRVAAEEEAALLRAAACEELFERRSDEEKISFAELFDCYGGARGWSALQEIVLNLYEYAQNAPDPHEWLRSSVRSFIPSPGNNIEDQPWSNDLREFVILELKTALYKIQEASALASTPGGPASYLDTLREDRELLERLLNSCSGAWEDLACAFAGVEFTKIKPAPKNGNGELNEELREQAKKSRDMAKRKITALHALIFSRKQQEYLNELHQLASLMRELVELTLEFGEIYRKAKRAHGVMDFSDLEHLALKILASPAANKPGAEPGKFFPSEVARQMQDRFTEVLVDEYQDINPVQEAILSLVSRQNRFLVGDVKQSIYRFRLTDPGIFLAKYKASAEIGAEARQRKINLSKNFRGQKNLIEAINYVFRQLMTLRTSEIDYEELVYGANYPWPEENRPVRENNPELHLLEIKDKAQFSAPVSPQEESEDREGEENTAPESFEELATAQREARLIARQISEMTSGKPPFSVYDKETSAYRPVGYRDIVVLLRSVINEAPIILEEFTRLGIPAYADVNTGYFQAIEIETMISLLKVIDNPRQDIPLAGVLRSPLVGLSLAEMARIRLCQPDADFYDALLAAASQGLKLEKINAFLSLLERWRTLSRQGPLSLLIWDIFRQTGYYDFCGGLPGGRQRQANLRALFSRARQYENTSFRGLPGFLNFIARLRENSRDLGTARALGENENVVRIMSIHKGKGLEFPVVFVARLGKQFNLHDLNKNILLHKDLGLGPQFVDLNTRVSYPTLPKIALQARLRRESLAEEMRLLYVAFTRAKEKLILVGSARNLSKIMPKWRNAAFIAGETLPEAYLAAAKTYLDWICPALLRQQGIGKGRQILSACSPDFPQRVACPPSCGWQIFLWGGSETFKPGLSADKVTGQPPGLSLDQKLIEKVKRLEPVEAGADFADFVARRLGWGYSHAGASLPAKLTATEAKRVFDLLPSGEDPSLMVPGTGTLAGCQQLRPKFLQPSKGLTPAEKGQAMHLVMQHLDFSKCLTEEDIKEQIDVLQLKEFLTSEQAAVINYGAIIRFLRSPLGKRCLSARSLTREAPFTLALRAGEIYPELAGSGETVLVQGMVDLFLEEDDGLVIIDFKTDHLEPGDNWGLEHLTQRYRGQLTLYARAIHSIFKQPVKEGYLYFLATGDAVLAYHRK